MYHSRHLSKYQNLSKIPPYLRMPIRIEQSIIHPGHLRVEMFRLLQSSNISPTRRRRRRRKGRTWSRIGQFHHLIKSLEEDAKTISIKVWSQNKNIKVSTWFYSTKLLKIMRVVGTASRKASLSPMFSSYSDFILIPLSGFWYNDLMTLRAAKKH